MIDLYKLEEEWQNQPALFNEWADELAAANRQVNIDEDFKKQTFAQVKNQIRKNPKKYGLDKITDKPVEDMALVHTDYIQSVDALNHSIYKRDVLKAFVDSLHQRKVALENEVVLFGQSYFAIPRVRNVDKKALEDANKREVRSKGVKQRKEK